jgi:PHD/YefM family antitoxin component YafN of YafNO toxin-antitoxin module
METHSRIKPISYLKSNAADIAQRLKNEREAITITQNGEASFVVIDVETHHENKETMALLKVLALGQKAYEEGKHSSADDFFAEMDKEILGEDEGAAE